MTRLQWTTTDLPVENELSFVGEAVSAHSRSLVLTAEPGAGKSSLVPLAVANAIDSHHRVILLEPRRLAARATANRLAELLGDHVGGLVGLTIRGQRSVSPQTRIEVVTEAVLTNRLQHDPELAGAGAIIFDEFHERNLHSDLGLAMAVEVRESLRDDLAIVVMSATLDPDPIADLLGGSPTLRVPGRTFPVETVYLPRPHRKQFPSAVADAVKKALKSVQGDILVFVPGRWEIDQVLRRIDRPDGVDLIGLHGGTAKEIQRQVLQPSSTRRIIVATAVAETSITIPGIEAVVDGGLLRRASFDPVSGLGRLETRFASRFAADQRRGRAGRLGPGVCFRLWSAEDDRLLDDAVPPAMVDGDPLPVAFELSRWGDPYGTSLPFLDHPGQERLEAGHAQLEKLGLVGPDARLNDRGQAAGRLPLHPRSAALVLHGRSQGATALAIRVAAAMESETRFGTADLERVLDQTRNDRDFARSVKRIRGALKPGPPTATTTATKKEADAEPATPPDLDELLAAAWPDRVAMARPGHPGRFLLAAGRQVEIGPGDPLHHAEFLVVLQADGQQRSAKIRLALQTTRSAVLQACAAHISWTNEIGFDERSDTLQAHRVQRLGAIVLHRQPTEFPEGPELVAALSHGIRRRGLSLFNWSTKANSVRMRLDWIHQQQPGAWPDVSEEALLNNMDEWLPLEGIRSVKQLASIDLASALLNQLDWKQRAEFQALAPTELPLPGGGSSRVDYSSGRPVWSVRLQRLLGLDQHPLLGPMQVPVTIELLSPANRPAQTTTDLPGFWRGSYQQVRTDLRGRYPKHAWPEDPLNQ